MIKYASADDIRSEIIAYSCNHTEALPSADLMIDLSIDLIGKRSISSAYCRTVGEKSIAYGHRFISGSISAEDGKITGIQRSDSPSSLVVIIYSSQLLRTLDRLSSAVDGNALRSGKILTGLPKNDSDEIIASEMEIRVGVISAI